MLLFKSEFFNTSHVLDVLMSLLTYSVNSKLKRKQFCFKARSQTRIRFKEGSPEECSLLSENFDDDDETDVDQVGKIN